MFKGFRIVFRLSCTRIGEVVKWIKVRVEAKLKSLVKIQNGGCVPQKLGNKEAMICDADTS